MYEVLLQSTYHTIREDALILAWFHFALRDEVKPCIHMAVIQALTLSRIKWQTFNLELILSVGSFYLRKDNDNLVFDMLLLLNT